MPREAMESDGDSAKRHLINPDTLRLLGDVRDRRVLGAGCGQGCFSRMPAARGAHVTGVEPTDAMFAYCREREDALRQGIRYAQADLTRLPDQVGGYATRSSAAGMVLPAMRRRAPATAGAAPRVAWALAGAGAIRGGARATCERGRGRDDRRGQARRAQRPSDSPPLH